MPIEGASSTSSGSRASPSELKRTDRGIILVPQPSDDPDDPLNWPRWRKHLMFAVMCFALFFGTTSVPSVLLAANVQAKTFNTDPQVLAYTTSGGVGGLLVGPLVFVPLARIFGMCSISFWTLLANVGFNIWSAVASKPEDLISYAVSRGLCGVVCVIPQILTGGFIVNVYFRHERGVKFAIYSTVYTLGSAAGATFGGFILQHTDWTFIFWWLVAGNGLAVILVFAIMQETGRNRGVDATEDFPKTPNTWLRSRMATFFPGNHVVPSISAQTMTRTLRYTYLIALSPATIIVGMYSLVNFAWLLLIQIELPIYLQEPYAPEEGSIGYGFDAQQTAFFYFSIWIGILLAQIWGYTVNDRIPLILSRRHNNHFQPEYRLYPAWVTGLFILPIGMGITGAGLQYHLHYMVLAVGAAITSFGAVASVPVPINYVVETFRSFPQEVGAVMNVYRLALSIALPFFFDQWVARVGVAWVFGIAAFLSVFVFGLLVVLMWNGEVIRGWSLIRASYDEEEDTRGEKPSVEAGQDT